VGLISLLLHEFYEYVEKLRFEQALKRKVSIATGSSAYNYIKELALYLKEKFKVDINVFEIKNEFFGENVTVAGLLTGRDIVSQLMGKDLGDELLVTKSMLKSGEDLFLDDYTVSMIENKLNVKINVVENSGKAFVDSVLGIN
jgi:NifB/MoaA-like Fe-S oxidoreductase